MQHKNGKPAQPPEGSGDKQLTALVVGLQAMMDAISRATEQITENNEMLAAIIQRLTPGEQS